MEPTHTIDKIIYHFSTISSTNIENYLKWPHNDGSITSWGHKDFHRNGTFGRLVDCIKTYITQCFEHNHGIELHIHKINQNNVNNIETNYINYWSGISIIQ